MIVCGNRMMHCGGMCVGTWRWRRDVCRRSRSQLSAAASRRPPPTLVRHARPRLAHLLGGRGTPTRAHSPHSCTLTPDTPITYSLHPVPVLLSRTFCLWHITFAGPILFDANKGATNKDAGSDCNSCLTSLFLSFFLFFSLTPPCFSMHSGERLLSHPFS